MLNTPASKKYLLISLLCLVLSAGLYAQNPEKTVFKKYVIKDSSSIYKSAVLLLYTDSTFINFGIVDDKKSLEMFLWCKAGNWNTKGDGIGFGVNEKIQRGEDLKKLIKFYYRRHPDRVLIESYYEFVLEKYSNDTLTVNPGGASDSDKKIEYYEIKL